MGDPTQIAGGLNQIYIDNPKMKVISTAVAHHILFAGQPGNIIQPGKPAQQAMPVHVIYVTFTGIDVLLDKNGKPLEGQ